jgi:outer membrane receptor protein involved in Fe transport
LSAQTYDQTFSAIASDRNSEALTRLQRVPAQAAGLIVQWTRPIDKHTLVGGFEAREVRGASNEIAYDRGNPSSFVDAGGRQRSYAVFFRDTFQVRPKFSISAGTRIDLFKNTNGLNVSRLHLVYYTANGDYTSRFVGIFSKPLPFRSLPCNEYLDDVRLCQSRLSGAYA